MGGGVGGRAAPPWSLFGPRGLHATLPPLSAVPAGLCAEPLPAYAARAAEAGLDLSGLTWGGVLPHNLLPVTLGDILGGVAVGGLFWACWLRKGRSA